MTDPNCGRMFGGGDSLWIMFSEDCGIYLNVRYLAELSEFSCSALCDSEIL